jgi:sugar phosphate isomerase/epimerase
MHLSIFNDEVGLDITDSISHFRDWGMEWIDLQDRVLGKEFSSQDNNEMARVAGLIKEHNLKVACLQSSLAKFHLPDSAQLELEKQ